MWLFEPVFWASSTVAILMISFEGTLQGESSGWHFSGYSFVATDKRVTRPQGETHEEVCLCLSNKEKVAQL